MKTLKRLRDLAITTSLFGGGLFGYVYLRTRKNMKEHLETLELSKDNTRQEN